MTNPKDNILYHTITELTESLAESDKEIERINRQLVNATERELALMAHVTRVCKVMDDNKHFIADCIASGSHWTDEAARHAIQSAEDAFFATPAESLAAHDAALWNDEVERLNRQLVFATDRELALMAHVDRFRRIAYWLMNGIPYDKGKGKPPTIAECREAFEEAPAQSLAAHDAAIEKRVWNEIQQKLIPTNPEKNLHLCDKCSNHFATCKSNPKFGCGKGNDNVYECDAFALKENEDG